MSQEQAPQRPASTLAERVAMNVRAELAAQRRTVADLAEVLHVGPRAARRRYDGELDFSLNETEIIADWLNVSIASLAKPRAHVQAAA